MPCGIKLQIKYMQETHIFIIFLLSLTNIDEYLSLFISSVAAARVVETIEILKILINPI